MKIKTDITTIHPLLDCDLCKKNKGDKLVRAIVEDGMKVSTVFYNVCFVCCESEDFHDKIEILYEIHHKL